MISSKYKGFLIFPVFTTKLNLKKLSNQPCYSELFTSPEGKICFLISLQEGIDLKIAYFFRKGIFVTFALTALSRIRIKISVSALENACST